jgi:hypothetical protein
MYLAAMPILVGHEINEAESSTALLDAIEPLVERLDAGTNLTSMGGIPHAKEQRIETPCIKRR